MKRIHYHLFAQALETTGSAGQRTLKDAMIEWYIAPNADAAMAKIAAEPGKDHAGITNSVLAALVKAADLVRCNPVQLISEADLNPLKNLTADQIVEIMGATHEQWIDDNWNSKRLIEKTGRNQLFQYLNVFRIGWEEASKDLLFFWNYLQAAGSTVTKENIQAAYEEAAADAPQGNDFALDCYKAMTISNGFGAEMVPTAEAFIKANEEDHPDRAQKVIDLLNANARNGEKILADILGRI